jgi:cob(I)alamin adenosyltransferase
VSPEVNPTAQAQHAAATPRGALLAFYGQRDRCSTAALGLALRAMGRGFRCAVVYFDAGHWQSGEELFSLVMPQLTYLSQQEAQQGLPSDPALNPAGIARAELWMRTQALFADSTYRFVVLDGIDTALASGDLPLTDVLAALRGRLKHQHLVLTAHALDSHLVELADEVTELRTIKKQAQAAPSLGIDF